MSEESTTPDLADVFHRLDEAMNKNDIDEVMSFFAADAVWDPPLGIGTYEGAAAIRGFFGEWARTYAEVSFDTADICELGSGVSFSVVNQRARLRGGGGQLALRYGLVTTWTDGLIQRQTTYEDIDEVRAAAERLAEERG
jgi:ketosteroid isomerase-like protein